MFVICECINVLIRLNKVDEENMGSLSIDLKGKNGYPAEHLHRCVPIEIDVQLPKLIRVRRYGNVLIHHCLHCGHDIYASYCNSSPEIVFAKEWMVNSEEVVIRKQSLNFSPYYKILIDPSELDPDFKLDERSEEKLSTEARLWLEDQTSITEKKIERYTNEQFAKLEKLKKRVYQDHNIIMKKLLTVGTGKDDCNRNKFVFKDNQIETSDVADVTLQNEINLEYPVYESDEVFFLDDVDMKRSSAGYYIDLLPEDPAEVQNGISENEYIPHATLMSKSLPLAVPQFICDKDYDRPVSPDVPVDIAASIKALARSVHGDKIFGDLPPPRFSDL